MEDNQQPIETEATGADVDPLTEKLGGLRHALAHVQADLSQARQRAQELERQALMLQGGILTLEELTGEDEVRANAP